MLKFAKNFIGCFVKIVEKSSLVEKKRENWFPSTPTVFVEVKMVPKTHLLFLSFFE